MRKGILVVAGAFLSVAEARAEDPSVNAEGVDEGGSLTWSAPTCPPRWKLEARVTRLLGEPLENFRSPRIDVRVSVLPDGQFDLVLAAESKGGPKERHFTGPDCDPLVDAAALAIALMIHPGLQLSDDKSDETENFEGPPSGTSEEGTGGSDGEEDPESEKSGVIVPPLVRPPPPDRKPLGFSAFLGPALDFGSLGGAAPGVIGEAALHWGQQWTLSGGAILLPSHKVQTQESGQFLLLGGVLRLCWSVPPSNLHLALCAGGQLGAIRGIAEHGERAPGWGKWLTPTFGVELGLPAGNWVLLARPEVLFPLSRDRYETAAGREVHTIPAISLLAALGARYKF